MGLSARAQAYRATTCAARCLLGRRLHRSALRSNARVFPVLRVNGAPHIPDYLFLLFIHPHSTNATPSAPRRTRTGCGVGEAESVRTGTGFWAAGHDSSHGSSGFSALQLLYMASPHSAASRQADDSGGTGGTEIAVGPSNNRSDASAHASALTWR